jgi:hypothetical protein
VKVLEVEELVTWFNFHHLYEYEYVWVGEAGGWDEVSKDLQRFDIPPEKPLSQFVL